MFYNQGSGCDRNPFVVLFTTTDAAVVIATIIVCELDIPSVARCTR